MRHAFLVIVLILIGGTLFTGCPRPAVPTGVCDDFTPCRAGFDCHGFRCIPRCELEGDCPLGRRCVDGNCIAECESNDDCDGFGVCKEIGEQWRGKACLLENLPQCREDWHCDASRICVDTSCELYCDDFQRCPAGTMCEPVDEWRGMCVDDPDYQPPVYNCADAREPDAWCKDSRQGVACDIARRMCVAPIVGFEIRDLSAIESADGTCATTDEDLEPGIEIQAIALLGEARESLPIDIIEVRSGGGDIRFDEGVLEPSEDSATCLDDPPILSPGCGGSVVVASVGEGGAPIELRAGMSIQVVERESACRRYDRDRFDIWLCRDMTDVERDIVCDTYLGTRAPGDERHLWPVEGTISF